MKSDVFWPYFAGLVCLAVGLWRVRDEIAAVTGLDKLVALGPVFLAFPMAAFGSFHFVATSVVAGIIPGWIPWHYFWTYFVGVALIAAAFSIALNWRAQLAATMVALMFLLFVVLMHIPVAVTHPGSRQAWAIVCRDSSFGAGACSLAARGRWPRLVGIARVIIACAALFYGVVQILHPALVPAVPLLRNTPTWVPLHLFWSYFAGVVYLATGVGMLFSLQARRAATYMGAAVVVVVLFVYAPILIAYANDVVNGLNYFADTLMFAGAIFLLASALPQKRREPATLRMIA